MRRTLFRLRLGLIGAAALLISTPGEAQPTALPQDVQAVLDRVASPRFETLRGEIRIEAQSPSQGGPTVTVIGVTLARPNRFLITVTSPTPDGDGLCASDGERALYVSHMLGQAAETSAPPTLSDLSAETLAMTGSWASVVLPVALGHPPHVIDALSASPLLEAHLLEPEEVGGAMCDVVELVADRGGGTMSVRLSVDRERDLLRRSEVSIETATPEQAASVVEEFTALRLDEPIGDDAFVATAPEGMERVSQLDTGAVIRGFGVQMP